MAKRFIAVGIAAAAAAAFAIGVKAETGSRLGFSVENDAGAVLASLEIAPLSSGRWQAVDLDREGLRPGDSAQARAEKAGSRCEYDVRAHLSTGAVVRQDDVDLCDLESDTLVIEG